MTAVTTRSILLPAILAGAVVCVAATAFVGLRSFSQTTKSSPFDAMTGYRISHFRAEVTSALPGGTILGIDALEELMRTSSPLLVDVISDDTSISEKLGDLLRGHPPARSQIAGSVWLPRLGLGAVTDQEALVQKGQLLALTDGALDRPMVFYCLSQCWVSWNAARRALYLGFQNVFWYRDGIEAWRDAGLPIEPAPHLPTLALQPAAMSSASIR